MLPDPPSLSTLLCTIISLLWQKILYKSLHTLFTATIRYFGPGKRSTGDWCFEDGFITFRVIAECYQRYFKGKQLGIGCDCSYSGSWVRACMESSIWMNKECNHVPTLLKRSSFLFQYQLLANTLKYHIDFSTPSGLTLMTRILELWIEWEMDGKLLMVNTLNLYMLPQFSVKIDL